MEKEKKIEEKRKSGHTKKDRQKKVEKKGEKKKKSKLRQVIEYEDDFEEDDDDTSRNTKNISNLESLQNKYENDFEEYSEDDEIKLEEQKNSSKIFQRLNNQKVYNSMGKKEVVVERPITRDIRRVTKNFNNTNQYNTSSSSVSRIINFDNARTINLESISSSLSRYNKFKNLIDIEAVTIFFDHIPPIKDYDFYMSMFGSKTKSQVGCQTGDDNKNIGIMTDGLFEKVNFWCQFPELDQTINWGTEGDKIIDNEIKKKEQLDEELFETFNKNKLRDEKLIKLVDAMEKIVNKITEVNEVNMKQKEGSILDHKSDFNFTYGYNELNNQFYSENASVTALHYSTSSLSNTKSKFLFVAVKMGVCKIDSKFNNKSFIIQYSTSNYKNIINIFCTTGEVTTLCTSPNNNTTLVAGTISGTILLFDFYESEKFFKKYKFNFDNNIQIYPVRMASFDTSYESLNNEFIEINSPIVSVYGFTSKFDTISFSLISLNENGILTLWNVYKIETPSIEIETNLGLHRPSSKLQMKKCEVLYPLKTIPSIIYSPTHVIANFMGIILPKNNKNDIQSKNIVTGKGINILIATGNGYVLNTTVSTLGIKKKTNFCNGPRLLTLLDENTFEITSIQSSPFSEHIFAIGLCTGNLIIGSIYDKGIKIILSPPISSKFIVTSIEWSPHENGVIYSIHNYNNLLIWNINISKSPIAVIDLTTSIGDENIKISTTKCFIGEDNYPYLIFGLTNGKVQIHRLENVLKIDDRKKNKSLDEILNNILS
ncbi:WD40 repeat and WD40/YVTN repeat-like-containing domain and WD40-repeat-containing domain-containing protein [Strongyloides ratti]|uniref:WD40 repeat and WD40/YVTN repeat-like-containing domain and WD40-repeat-containing domain-containing protein n=1 Tax=Strongyloides ratti TaxID=34506 RepID=A0A090L7B8_STRRB|nr:WD40 repeat and WD40/YVTN repeat-like-containing domain and WD40-repeat-containing domain-containing protein [Strongyloides ratti]CEF65622.1 WD40 repeat and WD40/YVTN repeat-like-containing domain and WD40-repeat-containing domain-containing protein [Strongyloides ratti]